MAPAAIIEGFGALAHEQRLAIFQLLIGAGSDGLAAGVIAERIGIAPSSLTFHIQSLLRCGLIRQRRASRNLIYSAEPGPAAALLSEFSLLCGLPAAHAQAPAATALRPTRVLALCTGNNALSVMAECLINDLGDGQWRAFSAGSDPAKQIHPLTLEVLRENNHQPDQLRCKSWNDFATPSALPMDLVVTLDEDVASELCPIWPGDPAEMHMGFPDPTIAGGNPQQKLAEFRRIYLLIAQRVRLLLRRPA